MSDAAAGATEESSPSKLDPEKLSLRAQPAPAVRFKRGMVIGLAAIASIGVFGVAWMALQPGTSQIVGRADEDAAVLSKAPADALAPLPSSYEQVPKLGRPLPGDLGRPILRRQQQSGLAAAAGAPQSMIDQAAAEQREQQAEEQRAARESAILALSADEEMSVATPSNLKETDVPAINGDRLALGPIRDPEAQQRKTDLISTASLSGVNPHRLQAPVSPYTLSAGSVIAASLITGLRSDLPGLVVAQVTEHVFDSATGNILLIPQGSRLVGSYDSVVAFGQRRALVVWQRLILPDGSSLQIENVPATDPSGYSGLADQVDFHTWSLLKGATISTLLGVGSNLTFSGESDLIQAIRESTQQNASRAGDQLVSRNLSIQPTITIRSGAAVRLVVHRDLILQPWQE
ncbi:TrbI/VirB10 family protein [Allosphingosinicella sp.]|uniref:TrbI/VirB10 family protein n=1 Tax=Allosphingosinicella sp. TaxID=2823234 RepID=UPI002FC16FB9